jgi:thioredoxin reductase
MRGIRGRIAARMETSRRDIPEATCSRDADLTELWELREDLSELARSQGYDVRISPFAVVLRATVIALRRFPTLNARIEGRDGDEPGEIHLLEPIHLGVAIDTERGLLVPVIHDAHQRSLLELALALEELAQGARAGTLSPRQLTGGTFTVNNYGAFGNDDGDPIINHPEAGILGVGAIRERPWVVHPHGDDAAGGDRGPAGRPLHPGLRPSRLRRGRGGPLRDLRRRPVRASGPPAAARLTTHSTATEEQPVAHDVVIVGGGPGGYAAAFRAAAHGLDVGLVEAGKVGGVCLHRGCVPSKALLHVAGVLEEVHRADVLGLRLGYEGIDPDNLGAFRDEVVAKLHKGLQGLAEERTTLYPGRGRLRAGDGGLAVEVTGEDGQTTTLEAANVVVATGSRPRHLPGVEVDGTVVQTSDEALFAAPPRSAVIVGAGAVGMEFASMWQPMGAEVTVIEALDRVLPLEDADVSRTLARAVKRRGSTCSPTPASRRCTGRVRWPASRSPSATRCARWRPSGS